MQTQDVINAITEQRNSALNELALCKAELAQTQRQLSEANAKLNAEPAGKLFTNAELQDARL